MREKDERNGSGKEGGGWGRREERKGEGRGCDEGLLRKGS